MATQEAKPLIGPKTAWGSIVLAGAGLLATISGYEGRSTVEYKDIVGVPTYCDGITYPKPVAGKVYTNAECDALLMKNVTSHGQAFLNCVKVPLNQNQYDAFASLAYNVGPALVCTSGAKQKPARAFLIDLLNSKQYTAACTRILAYNKAGGKFVQGLANRRAKESALCLKPAPVKTQMELQIDAPVESKEMVS